MDYSDDSSTYLGLNHFTGAKAKLIVERAAAAGIAEEDIRVDPQGRIVAQLPEHDHRFERAVYREDLDGKSPEIMAETIAALDDDRDGNNIEKLMREPPAGTVIKGGSRTPRVKRKGSGASGVSSAPLDLEPYTPRPHVLGARVSLTAFNAWHSQIETSGQIAEEIGAALAAGMTWHDLKAFCAKFTRDIGDSVALGVSA